MIHNILTYKDCLRIVAENDMMKFYMTKHKVCGYEVHIFNYKLAWFDDLKKPLIDSDINAYEMRGITFIFNTDGSLFKRFIMMNKFWNINQNDDSLLIDLVERDINCITYKEDGSLVSFAELPNGVIKGRSKASFSSDQAVRSTFIYDNNSEIKRLIDDTISKDICLLFEYVSPDNKIVLDYYKEELILIKARDNNTGEYLDINTISDDYDIKVTKTVYGKTITELSEEAKVSEDIEGWVIEMVDGSMFKQKTEWYFIKHKLFTEMLNRDNDIISLIINDDIDDVMSKLGDSEADKNKKKYINEIIVKVNSYITDEFEIINNFVDDNFDGDLKAFANKYKKDKRSHFYFKVIYGGNLIEDIKNDILKKTQKLNKAILWLSELN